MSNESFFAITLGAAILTMGISAPKENLNRAMQTGERIVAESRYQYDVIRSTVADLPREIENATREIREIFGDLTSRATSRATTLKHQIDFETGPSS